MESNDNNTTTVQVKFWAVLMVVLGIIGFLCIGFATHGSILSSHSSQIEALSARQDRMEQNTRDALNRIENKIDRLIESR